VINYALVCDDGHKFDAWFKSVDAYDAQSARGIVTCPVCMSSKIGKQMMAPAISRSGSEKISLSIGHPEHAQLRAAMKALRQKVVSEADYVGDKFADEARKIHLKEIDPRGIYGEATRDEVAELIDEGVDFMPLPNLPDEHN
jgi:hypothetical protein